MEPNGDDEEDENVPFAVALRRRVGRQTGNAGRNHREDEIARDVNVRFTTVPIAGAPGTKAVLLASLRLVEDEHSQHWGGHVWCGHALSRSCSLCPDRHCCVQALRTRHTHTIVS
jgi:hypothetical protein